MKRFDLDAAIIFSDILMVPYGLNQKVEFKKNFGPILGNLDLDKISQLDEIDFVEKIYPVYKAINLVKNNNLTKNKSTIGFIGAVDTSGLYDKQTITKKKFKKTYEDNFLINS